MYIRFSKFGQFGQYLVIHFHSVSVLVLAIACHKLNQTVSQTKLGLHDKKYNDGYDYDDCDFKI